MNALRLIDDVTSHLLTQGERSIHYQDKDKSACAYRGDDGTRCAIGCLIPDELYQRGMENRTVNTLLHAFPELQDYIFGKYNINDFKLLTKLQCIHDANHPCRWPEALRDLRAQYV